MYQKIAKWTTSYFTASVAQLDARPTGDQEVAGSTPAEVLIVNPAPAPA